MQNTITKILIIIGLFSYVINDINAQNIEKVDTLKQNSINKNRSKEKVKEARFSKNKDMINPSLKNDTLIKNDTLKKKTKSDLDAQVKYNADTIRTLREEKKLYLSKDAFIKYKDIELNAAIITYDFETKNVTAKPIKDENGKLIGKPVFKDSKESFTAEEIVFNFETKKALIKNVTTNQEGGKVFSRTTKKINDDEYCIKNGRYTTDTVPKHPHYYIAMTKAKMRPGDIIVSGPAYLVIEDVPMPLGIPFGFFPITKSYSSGVLIPSYGEESSGSQGRGRGFFLQDGGYYFAINDYFDFQLRGDIYTNGSWALRASTKYKKRYKYSGSFSGAYNSNVFGEEGEENYMTSKDFSIKWQHTQDSKANPYSTFSASVDLSSSSNDRLNSRNIRDIANTRKSSSISYSKKWPDSPFSVSVALRHSQNSADSTISLGLPNINFNMSNVYPFRGKKSTGKSWYEKFSVNYSAKMENSINIKEKDLMDAGLKKWRNGFHHSIPFSFSFKLAKDLTFSPSFRYEGAVYSNSIRKYWDPNKIVSTDPQTKIIKRGGVAKDTVSGVNYAHKYSTSASISYSPKIFGFFRFKKSSKVAVIRHSMTPSISMSYTPKFGVREDKYFRSYFDYDQNKAIDYSIYENYLYGNFQSANRESGVVSFSLNNNFEMKVRKSEKDYERDTTSNNEEEEFKKITLLKSLNFSTNYDLLADSMNMSPISMRANTDLFQNKFNVNFSSTFDPYKINKQGVRINEYGVRLINASVTTSFRLDKAFFGGKEDNKEKKQKNKKRFGYEYANLDKKWNLSVNYRWSYQKAAWESSISQSVNFNGGFELTPKWKFSFSSGYDFAQKKVTMSNINVHRDLSAWEMTFSTIPFGQYQSFRFTIRVKAQMLKDLKWDKNETWYEQ